MKKSLFYLICAVMGGLIAALGLLIAKKFGFAVSVSGAPDLPSLPQPLPR